MKWPIRLADVAGAIIAGAGDCRGWCVTEGAGGPAALRASAEVVGRAGLEPAAECLKAPVSVATVSLAFGSVRGKDVWLLSFALMVGS